jgi:molybdopterin converting factor small subunit
MKATVRLFGQFRNRAGEPRLELELASDANAQDAKLALARTLFGETPHEDDLALIEDSALASSVEVLAPSTPLAGLAHAQGRVELAILPPVCGG